LEESGDFMAITLRKLCINAKEDYGMKLLCSEDSMDNMVDWVHMLEDPETAKFLHGKELIITTGIGHDNTDWFVDFAKALVKSEASGLILNIGPYIDRVPEDLLDYCEAVGFPLFSMPWKTRIVDVSSDFCHKIVKAEETEMTVASAFKNAIFFPERISEYQSILERKAFDLEAEFCVAAISLHVPSNDKLAEYDKNVRMHLNKILFNYGDLFSLFRQDKYLIVVMQNFPIEIIEKSFESLQVICNYGNLIYRMRGGIAINELGISSLPQSYKRAMAMLRIAEKQEKKLVSYRELGIYQILIEIEDTKVLKRFYKSNLGVLVDFDEKNQTDYYDTLKLYLNHNNSVEKVAKETFVHRNTINYKMRKIKEILCSELNYEDGLKLVFAYHIKDFL